MSEPVRLSASKIKTVQSCSWLYWAQYILKLPQKPNTGASRGLCAHIALECLTHPKRTHYVMDVSKEGKDLRPSVKRLIRKNAKKLGVDDPDNIEMVEDMVKLALKSNFLCEGCCSLAAEENFIIKTPRYLINGFIDKTASYPDGTFEIWDYKSSKAKFTKEELEFNIQALMYSLACWKNKKQIPKVKFLFLRFPRTPLQEPPVCTERQLKGFEAFLEHISGYLSDFDENKAVEDLAFKDKSKSWLCGKEGFKEDGSVKFICQYRKPFTYYALLDEKGAVITTSFENDLIPKENQKVEKLNYVGCPAFRKTKTVTHDDFDF